MTPHSSCSSIRVPHGAPIRVDSFALHSDCSDRPTVRIFVGTQSGQHRAERTLAWSIHQHRSLDRSYEIHWIRSRSQVREPESIERAASWVPQLSGGSGRALYCTVDQVYLSDPAELFDSPMNGYAVLGPASGDHSALLIDCAKLASSTAAEPLLTASQRHLRNTSPDLRGPLPDHWDAVADHYAAGRSRRVQYKTLHTQPWRPFPDRYVYHRHPNAELWQGLESDANRAGFEVFSRTAPSGEFSDGFCQLSSDGKTDPTRESESSLSLGELLGGEGSELVAHDVCIRESLAKLSGRRISVYSLDSVDRWRRYLAEPFTDEPKLAKRWGASEASILDPSQYNAAGHADAVICANTLDSVPSEDLPWLLGELFDSARSLVHLGIRPAQRSPGLRARRGDPIRRTLGWWTEQIETAASRHPDVHWQVVFCAGAATEVRHGGRHIGDAAPTVWVLTDDRPGNTSQSVGLADGLGWPYTVKRLRFSVAARLHNRLLGASRIGVDRHRSSPLCPPWPDLVIAAGRRSAPVAQWIRARNFGQTRLVHLGRKGGDAADQFDLVVSPSYGRLDPHPRRLITSAPLHNISRKRIEQATERFSERLANTKRPRIAVLVGGWSGQYKLDIRTARKLGEDVVRLADELGGSILATTSRRAGIRGSEAFCAALPDTAHIYRWSADSEDENPYLAFLGFADGFVATADSESMLSEAASQGRPIRIYPLPERASFGWMRKGRDWVYARAHARSKGRTTQRGLEYWCARSIEIGLVRPVRDLKDLHEGLIREGVAQHFGEPFDSPHCEALGNGERVVERVSALLGFEAQV